MLIMLMIGGGEKEKEEENDEKEDSDEEEEKCVEGKKGGEEDRYSMLDIRELTFFDYRNTYKISHLETGCARSQWTT